MRYAESQLMRGPVWLIACALIMTYFASVTASAQMPEDRFAQSTPDQTQYAVIISPQADDISVTIYPRNLAMITETRRINLPQGRSTIKFAGVTDRIVPQTVVLREFSGFTLERNFDYNVMSQGALFANAVGETVSIIRTNRVTGEVKRQAATIVSAGVSKNYWQDTLQGVVFEIDGKYETFQCSGGIESVAFDKVPPQLSSVPILSIDVDAPAAGPQDIVISYLTSGLGWEADYRVDIQADKTANILGWLSIENSTAKRFENVPLTIIAGDLQRTENTYGNDPRLTDFQSMCWPRGSTKEGMWYFDERGNIVHGSYLNRESFVSNAPAQRVNEVMHDYEEIVVTGSGIVLPERVGDYKLYRVPVPVTIAAYQTKQFAFLDAKAVDIQERIIFDYIDEDYDYSGEDDEYFTALGNLQFQPDNSKDGNLGKPLPRGTMRIFDKTRSGLPFHIGDGRIKNSAVGLPVEVNLNQNSSVGLRSIASVLDDEDGQAVRFSQYFFNPRSEPVTARFFNYDMRFLSNEVVIRNETRPRTPDKEGLVWDTQVPANGQARLSFDIPVIRAASFKLPTQEHLKDGRPFRDIEVSLQQDDFLRGTVTSLQELGIARANIKPVAISVISDYDFVFRNGDTAREFLYLEAQHTLTNSTQQTQIIAFGEVAEARGNCLFVMGSNVTPLYPEVRAWVIELEAGKTRALKYIAQNVCSPDYTDP